MTIRENLKNSQPSFSMKKKSKFNLRKTKNKIIIHITNKPITTLLNIIIFSHPPKI